MPAKTFADVLKFNPYHDQRGRFASSSSYTRFTIRTKDPNKQYMADRAIAREKERHAAATANPTNDPEYIAGVKRGKPMSHEEADHGNANPWYYAGREYRTNCQSCIMAYEARLRGYDVEAQPRNNQNRAQTALMRDQKVGWRDPKTGQQTASVKNPPNINRQTQVTKWLNDNIEEGARYAFAHGWKGTDGRVGHVISATKEGGKIKFFDPQSGKNYEGEAATKYIGRVRATWNNGYETKGRLELIRLDNKQLDQITANAVLKGTK